MRETVTPTTNVLPSPSEAPPPPVVVESRPVPPLPSEPPDEEQVQAVLTRWARAYSDMNARGVDDVQPGSAAALTKQFAGLRSVSVVLSGCRIAVQESRATAACTEQIRTEGVVAGGSLNTSRGRQFVLQKADGRWRITSARIGS